MNPTNSLSVNSQKSLALLSDFEHNIVQDSDLKDLSSDEKKSLLQLAKFYLSGIQEDKTNFIATTKLHRQSNSYQKKIAEFNTRKKRITKSYLIIENSLAHDKEIRRIQAESINQLEQKWLYFFLKTSKTFLESDLFNQILNLTNEQHQMPESLMGRF